MLAFLHLTLALVGGAHCGGQARCGPDSEELADALDCIAAVLDDMEGKEEELAVVDAEIDGIRARAAAAAATVVHT
jgi:hypothetical protein